MKHVAIIGAGLAGLTAARELARAGLTVSLFDKARGPGGRTSTRRAEPFAFDHGAQYFTCKGESFRRTVASWCDGGVVAPWGGRFVGLRAGTVTPSSGSVERFVGVPRMSAIARHLADGLDVSLKRRAERIEREGGGWKVRFEEGPEAGPFDALVVATPAPQAEPLLASAGQEDLAALAGGVAMSPCHALMLGYDGRVDVDFDGAFVAASPIAWIARNSSKPEREAPESWIAHTTPEWSAARLDEPTEAIIATLSGAFEAALGRPVPRAIHSGLHLWRLALAPEPLDRRCVWDPRGRIGVCGDWLHGARVESAVESGRDMAAAMLGADPPA